MNTKIITTIAFLALSAGSYGQIHESGVFLSKAAYIDHKLTYRINCANEKHTINLYDYWNKPTITVVHNGEKYIHKKSNVFGFQDCNNIVYRFFKNSEYRIEETGNVIIYTVERTSIPGQGFKKLTDFYFSRFCDSEIFPLDVKHLKLVYAENKTFCNLLDSRLEETDISSYDKLHKKYKINHLYDLSKSDR